MGETDRTCLKRDDRHAEMGSQTAGDQNYLSVFYPKRSGSASGFLEIFIKKRGFRQLRTGEGSGTYALEVLQKKSLDGLGLFKMLFCS